jgi:SAM-dependent methyltransferase
MKPPASAQQPDAMIRWMASLGDPARLRLLRLLERHELGVAELGDVLQLPQSTISRHVKLLADEGWLRSRRLGTTHLSTIAEEGQLAPAQRDLWHLARTQIANWPAVAQDDLRLASALRHRHDDSRRFFTGAAGEWDALRVEYYGDDFPWHAMVALLPRDSVVADLGCGTGASLEAIAPHVGRAIGVDNTPAMLEAAAQRLDSFDNVELLQGDLAQLPIESGSVDAAMMVLALSYVADPSACVAEVTRVLRPGGRVAIVDVTAHDREAFRLRMGQRRLGFDAEAIAAMLDEAGLVSLRVRNLPPVPNVKGPALFLATGARPTSINK